MILKQILPCVFLQSHPGTNVTVIDLYDGFSSLVALATQSSRISPQVEAVMKEHPEGVHVIGYSQGMNQY